MIRHYIMSTVRSARRAKFYVCLNLTGLGLGLACCLGVGIFVAQQFSFDRHHTKAQRIYRLLWEIRGPGGDMVNTLTTQGRITGVLRTEFPEVERTIRTFVREMSVERQGRQYSAMGCFADPEIFDVFDYPMVQGNPLAIRNPGSAFLTQSAAVRIFGSEDPIGQEFHVDYKWGLVGDFTVAGILADMPESTSSLTTRFDFLTATIPKPFRDRRWNGSGPLFTYLLLKEGADASALEARLTNTVNRLIPDGVSRLHGQVDSKTQYHLQPLTRIHLYSRADYGVSEPGGATSRMFACASQSGSSCSSWPV